MTLVQIAVGIVSLSLLILAHEGGHYLLARRAGIVVERFAIFWGPTLWRCQRGNTLYSLGLIPLGGYCKMRADLDSLQCPRAGDYYGARWSTRLLVMMAGPLASVLLGLLLLFTLNTLPRALPLAYSNQVVVLQEVEGAAGPAAVAGLKDGDRILAVNGQAINSFADLALVRRLSPPFRLEYQRPGQAERAEVLLYPPASGARILGVVPWLRPTFQQVPQELARQGVRVGDTIQFIAGKEVGSTYRLLELLQAGATELGIDNGRVVQISAAEARLLGQIQPYFSVPKRGGFLPPWQAIARTGRDAGEAFSMLWRGLTYLFTGTAPLRELLVGPLRLSEFIGASLTVERESWEQWLRIMALVSMNLAVVNLLPFPGLDGGSIFFSLLMEMIPRPFRKRGYLVYTWMAGLLLLALLALVLGLDLLYYFRSYE